MHTYNYNMNNRSASIEREKETRVSGIESGGFSLKSHYAYEKLNEKEKDMFEEYQRRITQSVTK